MKASKKSFFYNLSWSAFDIIGTKVVSVFVQLILSRILVPEDFGLIAMISILIGFSELLIDGGLGQSLIRAKEVTKIDYSTVFIFNIFVGIFFYLIIFFSSQSIAEFYSTDKLINITRVYTLSLLINSFVVVNRAILLKNLRFNTTAKINIISVVIGSIIGIVLALENFGVWSIVFMKLSISLLSSILFLISQKWKFIFVFNWSVFKYHFFFGYKLILLYLTKVISEDLYSVIIGKFYNVSYLGLYNRASVLNKSGVIAVGRTFSNVTYSLFNVDKSNKKFIRKSIMNINKIMLLFYFPSLIFLFFNSDIIIYFLLGSNWSGVVPFFKILLLGSLFEPFSYYYSSILNTYNKPNVALKINFSVRLISILIALLFYNHITTILILCSISYVVISFLLMRYGGILINYKISSQFFDVRAEISMILLLLLVQIIFVIFTKYSDLTNMFISFGSTIIIMILLSKIFSVSIKNIFNFLRNDI